MVKKLLQCNKLENKLEKPEQKIEKELYDLVSESIEEKKN